MNDEDNNESLTAGSENVPEEIGAQQAAPVPDLTPESGNGKSEVNLDVIMDVPVTLIVEIGRTRLPIRDLLQLNHGSVIEMGKLVGEPHDVLINGTLIAHGEVVIVDDKFGIRFTDIVSPSERIKRLK